VLAHAPRQLYAWLIFNVGQKKMSAGDRHYEKAATEGDLDRGLFARCYSEAEGDERKTRALYLKMRAIVLSKEEAQRIDAEKEKAAIAEAMKLEADRTKQEHAASIAKKHAEAESERLRKQFPFSRTLILGFLILVGAVIYFTATSIKL
jgi:hypothetical protein